VGASTPPCVCLTSAAACPLHPVQPNPLLVATLRYVRFSFATLDGPAAALPPPAAALPPAAAAGSLPPAAALPLAAGAGAALFPAAGAGAALFPAAGALPPLAAAAAAGLPVGLEAGAAGLPREPGQPPRSRSAFALRAGLRHGAGSWRALQRG
jgi:hypothetical protein